MGIGQMVTDRESVTIETLLITTLSECAIFSFAKPLLHSFRTSAENLGQSRSYPSTKADAECLSKMKGQGITLCKEVRTCPRVDINFPNYFYCKPVIKILIRCQKVQLKGIHQPIISMLCISNTKHTGVWKHLNPWKTALLYFTSARWALSRYSLISSFLYFDKDIFFLSI